MRNSPKMGQKWFFGTNSPRKIDQWSPPMMSSDQNILTPQKNGPKTARKLPKMKNSPKMGQKWLFGKNSLWKILIFWEIIHFYKILKKQSNPGKLHTLEVEVALREVCGGSILFPSFIKVNYTQVLFLLWSLNYWILCSFSSRMVLPCQHSTNTDLVWVADAKSLQQSRQCFISTSDGCGEICVYPSFFSRF